MLLAARMLAAKLLAARLLAAGCWLQAASKGGCKAVFSKVPVGAGSSQPIEKTCLVPKY